MRFIPLSILCVLLLASGCASTGSYTRTKPAAKPPVVTQAPPPVVEKPNEGRGKGRQWQARDVKPERRRLSPAMQQRYDRIMASVLDWWGTPYLFGGTTRDGIDCSAFVRAVFKQTFDIQLTRTTWTQVQEGREVQKDEWEIGDLIFFKTAAKSRHVGIYMGDYQFAHSSTNSGVTISDLRSPFWVKTYWTTRRMLPDPEIVADAAPILPRIEMAPNVVRSNERPVSGPNPNRADTSRSEAGEPSLAEQEAERRKNVKVRPGFSSTMKERTVRNKGGWDR